MKKTILLVFVAGLILRLFLLPYGNHVDLIINTEWGLKVFEKGPLGFYTDRVWIYGWPTQLPVVNLIYGFNMHLFEKILWYFSYFKEVVIVHQIRPDLFKNYFNFVYWFGTENYKNTPYNNGQIISMKVIPLLSDLLIALLIFLLSVKKKVIKRGLIIMTLFLFLPFSWYLSSLWGQYDQVASLLILVSLFVYYYSEKENYFVFSASSKVMSFLMFIIACSLKPTNILLGALFLALIVKSKNKIVSLLSLIPSLLMFLVTNRVFTGSFSWRLFYEDIFPKVFNNDRLGLVNHAFNFWQFLFPGGGWANSTELFGIKTMYWGFAFLLGFLCLAVRILNKRVSLTSLLASILIISGGAYIFFSGMVDRYYYTAIVTLTLLCVIYPKLKYLWLSACILFSLNLFYTWGYPFLPEHLVWGNSILIRVFSLMQTFIFVLTVYRLVKLVDLKK